MQAQGLPTSGSVIQTFAGTEYTWQWEGRLATGASIGLPQDVTVDAAGNIYYVDSFERAYRVTADGNVHLLAGNGFRSDPVDGIDARKSPFTELSGIGVGPDGSVYLGLRLYIKKILPEGTLAAVAGGGDALGDGGKATAARLSLTNTGFIWDAAGDMLFSDTVAHRVRRIDNNGNITTIAGNGQNAFSGDGGLATNAGISFPTALHFDSAGNLYILESGSGRIRKVTPAGAISTLVSQLVNPYGMDFDSSGNILVSERAGAHRITRISSDGKTRTTFAGSSQGFADGPSAQAQFNSPQMLRIDAKGNVLVADTSNGRIRMVSADGKTVSTIAGNGLYAYSPDGTPAPQSYFETPHGLAFSPSGALYISDEAALRVSRVEADGSLTRIAGIAPGGNVVPNYAPAPARSTPLVYPHGMTFDRQGNLYIADSDRIRRVTPDGTISTYAGGGTAPPTGGPATAASLPGVFDVVIDSAGNLMMTTQNNQVLKVAASGSISVFAGTGVSGFQDGAGSQAQFAGPLGLAIDSKDNVYVADQANRRVRKITPNGTVSTYAGSGYAANSSVATLTDIGVPQGLSIESDGSLLITSQFATNGANLSRVRPDGSYAPLVDGGEGFAGDGGPALNARLNLAQGVTHDAAGNIFIADSGNSRVRVIRAAVPTMSATPGSLSFSAQAGDPPTTPQQIQISSSVTGLPISVTASSAWVSISVDSATTPATVNLSVAPATLAPGTYSATVTITSSAVGVAPVSVTANVTIQSAKPPRLQTDTNGLSFSVASGAASTSRRVVVSNAGGGSLPFTVSATTASGGKWLSLSQAVGTVTAAVPVSLTVSADGSSLAPDTYKGTVVIADSSGSSIAIPVTLTVSSSGQLIQLSQTGVSSFPVAGGGSYPIQGISVIGTGPGSIPFSVSTSVPPGFPSWLSVTPSNGSVTSGQPAPVLNINADPTGLPAGDYYGRIEVTAPTADNSPRDATVVMSIQPAGPDQGPLVQPWGLVFTGAAGGHVASQSATIFNLAPQAISFGSAVATLDGGHYIQYRPASETVAGAGSLQIEVQPDLSGLSAGVYRGAVVLVFSNGAVKTISILIVVTAANTGHAVTDEAGHAVTGCTPAQLQLQITSLGVNFNVPAAFPTPLVAKVVDDCGSPHVQGSVVATFSNGDPPLLMLSQGDGVWSATWVGIRKTASPTTITITAENPASKLKGTTQLSGRVSGNGNPPIVSGGGIISSSSFALQAPLAPGAFVSIFGDLLSNGTAQAAVLPLDSQLAGTQVLVAGRLAPLLFSSSGQVNAILPLSTAVNAPVQMIIARGNQLSVPVDIPVASTAPGIFSIDGSGGGQGHIYIAQPGGLKLANSSSPAKAGDTLVLYCTGLGALDSDVPDGGLSPVDHLVNTRRPVSVTIGNTTVPAAFAGLSPGFAVGLYQVNVVVPPGITASDLVSVTVSVGGQTSPPVSMSIR